MSYLVANPEDRFSRVEGSKGYTSLMTSLSMEKKPVWSDILCELNEFSSVLHKNIWCG